MEAGVSVGVDKVVMEVDAAFECVEVGEKLGVGRGCGWWCDNEFCVECE